MKIIRFKPYSKTSYLPANLDVTDDTSVSELLHLFKLQTKEIDRLNLKVEHQQMIIEALTAEVEHLKSVNKGQRDALFGRSSETTSLVRVS